MSIEKIEKSILNYHKREIRVAGLLRKRKENLKEFIIKFLDDWNNKYNTIYIDNREIQTDMGKRRTLGDLYMICKYYYPDFQFLELIELLYIILPKEVDGFRSSMCSILNKRVWYIDPDRKSEILNLNYKDEFGNLGNYYFNLFKEENNQEIDFEIHN